MSEAEADREAVPVAGGWELLQGRLEFSFRPVGDMRVESGKGGLAVDEGKALLWLEGSDGGCQVSFVQVHGRWLRQDGQPGRARGSVEWNWPLDDLSEEQPPPWVVERVERIARVLSALEPGRGPSHG